MKKISLKQKIALIFLGLFLSIIMLEGLLGLGKTAFLFFQERRNRISLSKQGTYKIMCLGESTTALGGKYSYPSQLEDVLNFKSNGIKFSVINKGIPGATIDVIAEDLDGYLDKYKPDVVLTMLGANNQYSVKDKIFYGNPGDPKTYKCINFLKECLTIKDVKPFANDKAEYYRNLANNYFRLDKREESKKACIKSLRLDPVNINALMFLTNFYKLEVIENIYKEALSSYPGIYYVFLNIGQWYRDSVRNEEAIEAFETVLKFDKETDRAYWAYFELGGCHRHMKDYKVSEEMYKKAISLNPSKHNAYAGLALCYKAQNRQSLSNEYFEKAKELDLEKYDPDVRENYLKIMNILKQRAIKHCVVQYPMRNIETLKRLLDYDQRIVFIDNEQSFKRALKHSSYEEYFKDSFGGDFGHCTPKGNRLLAENIADVILENFFKK